ncbi:MAG: CO dehydrogenase/CO-methylating acetyl-CoA synthase complex subunit beta, partial [Candidatus Omnitrophota bacterium]
MSKTAEVTVKVVAGVMIRGAKKILGDADSYMTKAIREKGADSKIAFPETAFYFPLANALLGLETKTLADAKKILDTAKTLVIKDVPSEDKWTNFLKDSLNAGVATILSEE